MGKFDSLFIVYDRIEKDFNDFCADDKNVGKTTERQKILFEAQIAIIDTACNSLDPDFDCELWKFAYEVKDMYKAYDAAPSAVRGLATNDWKKANCYAEYVTGYTTLFTAMRQFDRGVPRGARG